MSNFLDQRYINLVGPTLQLFKKKSSNTWNFRCPLCGDSQKDRLKTRGYFYTRDGEMWFFCHNCRVARPFYMFLKENYPHLYSGYQMDRLREKAEPEKKAITSDSFRSVPEGFLDEILEDELVKPTVRDLELPTLNDLPSNHPAKVYALDRKFDLGDGMMDYLSWTDDWGKFVLDIFPDCDKEFKYTEGRIVIPMRDKIQTLMGVQGRSLDPDKRMKYQTIKFDDECAKCFGLDRVDLHKPIRVVEGALDTFFIDNCMATLDNSLYTLARIINHNRGEYVDIYDNDPRNGDVKKAMRKSINMGNSIVIWPEGLTSEDPNDMIKDGHNVNEIVEARTFKGLQAELEMKKWEK